MKTTFPTESHTSPAPGIIPEPPLIHDEAPASSAQGTRQAPSTTAPLPPRRSPPARLLAALRGDKYMVEAYPPADPATKEQ